MSEVHIKTVRPKHEAIAQWIIGNPEKGMLQCALTFGVTRAWLSVVVNSDVFRSRLAELNAIVIEEVVMPLRAKLNGVAHLAVERLGEQVEKSTDGKFLLSVADKTLHRLDYGHQKQAPSQGVSNVQNNFYSVDPKLLAEVRERRTSSCTIQAETSLALEDKTEDSMPSLLDKELSCDSSTITVPKEL